MNIHNVITTRFRFGEDIDVVAMAKRDNCVLLGTPRPPASHSRPWNRKTKTEQTKDGEEFVPGTFRSTRNARASAVPNRPEDYMEEEERNAWKAKHLGVFDEYGSITRAMQMKSRGEGKKADERDSFRHTLGLQQEVATLLTPTVLSVGMRLLGPRFVLPGNVSERDGFIKKELDSIRKMARKDAGDHRGLGCVSLQRWGSARRQAPGTCTTSGRISNFEDEDVPYSIDLYGEGMDAPGFASIAFHGEDSDEEWEGLHMDKPKIEWRTRDPTSPEGFLLAQSVQRSAEWFPPPEPLEKRKQPRAQLPKATTIRAEGDLESNQHTSLPVAPPVDEELKKRIDSLAAYVARNGEAFEQMAKQKQRADPRFSFLHGGIGATYYKQRKLALCQASKHVPENTEKAPGFMARGSRDTQKGATGRLLKGAFNQDQSKIPRNSNPSTQHDASHVTLNSSISDTDKGELKKCLNTQFTAAKTVENVVSTEGGLQLRHQYLDTRNATLAKQPQAYQDSAPLKEENAPNVGRTISSWQPDPLVCKRFNLRCPRVGDRGSGSKASRPTIFTFPVVKDVQNINREVKNEMNLGTSPPLQHNDAKALASSFLDELGRDPAMLEHMKQDIVVDEDGTYVQRPMEIFRAIFQSRDAEDREVANPPPDNSDLYILQDQGHPQERHATTNRTRGTLDEHIEELQSIYDAGRKDRKRKKAYVQREKTRGLRWGEQRERSSPASNVSFHRSRSHSRH